VTRKCTATIVRCVPSIVSALAATAASGIWRDERINDDRFHFDCTRGLAFVADALGPTYGGYYAPFAIDPGISALLETFHGSDAFQSTRERLVTAVQAAHALMRAMDERYREVRGNRTGGEASRRAADALRPPAWQDFDSYAHFMGSLTACAVGPDAVVLAQIGDCRAYRLDQGIPELLVRDHTLLSVLEESGGDPAVIAELRQSSSRVVAARLGGDTLPLKVAQIAPPVTIALVTDGVWRHRTGLERLMQARTQEHVRALVSDCAKEGHDDATAVVLEVR